MTTTPDAPSPGEAVAPPRGWPVIPTILVLAAVATMIALGIWQLQRKGEKEALIAQAERSLAARDEVILPSDAEAREELLYRRTRMECATVQSLTTVAGTSLRGEKGLAQRATCLLADGTTARVDIGFSRRPEPVEWDGGSVVGTIAPGGRIVATEPLAGLEPLAAPDPRDLPNNHLAAAPPGLGRIKEPLACPPGAAPLTAGNDEIRLHSR